MSDKTTGAGASPTQNSPRAEGWTAQVVFSFYFFFLFLLFHHSSRTPHQRTFRLHLSHCSGPNWEALLFFLFPFLLPPICWCTLCTWSFIGALNHASTMVQNKCHYICLYTKCLALNCTREASSRRGEHWRVLPVVQFASPSYREFFPCCPIEHPVCTWCCRGQRSPHPCSLLHHHHLLHPSLHHHRSKCRSIHWPLICLLVAFFLRKCF